MELFECVATVAETKPVNPYAELARLLFQKSKHPAAAHVLKSMDWAKVVNTPAPAPTANTAPLQQASSGREAQHHNSSHALHQFGQTASKGTRGHRGVR